VLYALRELGVLETERVEQRGAPSPEAFAFDPIDDEALRKRILSRTALVEDGDYFALLGIGREATPYDIQRAYQQLRHQLDPRRALTATTADLRDELDIILEVLDEAYEILSDDRRRERYRRALEAAPR
jgi:preprotein translocase subunit Sec63